MYGCYWSAPLRFISRTNIRGSRRELCFSRNMGLLFYSCKQCILCIHATTHNNTLLYSYCHSETVAETTENLSRVDLVIDNIYLTD